MNQIPGPHQALRNLINPANPRRALVVEGGDDVRFVERQLDLRSPGWNASWVVGPAEGKSRVRDIAQLEPTWFGLVDTDEWDAATLALLPGTDPNLYLLPRYCLESYFVIPGELWGMLPAVQHARVHGGLPAFEAALLAPLGQWVRHGALWRVVNPLWAGLRARGFKDYLLQLNIAQSDADIQTKLQEWHNYLNAGVLFAQFQAELVAAIALPQEDKLKRIIHGKSFFTEHVCHTLNGFFGQRSAADWLDELTKSTPALPELDPIWAAMGL